MKIRIVYMLLASALSAAAGAETVVVVSAKSAVATLSKEQVADLFVGKTQQLGGASAALVDQAELKEDFYTKATGRNAAQIKATWAKLLFTGKGNPPKEVSGNAEVKKFVAGNPAAIGYIDKAAVDGSVKVVLSLP